MADITHAVTITWTSNNAGLLQSSVTLTGQEENNLGFSLPGSTTNELHSLAFLVAKLVLFLVYSDQDITIKTNSSGSPQETLTIKAGKPFLWYKNSGVTIPFAGNVTAAYFTNAGSTAAAVNVKVLEEQP
jgi:hypothetical protein